MKFCWSTLRVNDMDESIKFYTDIVGLEVESRFKAGPVEIAFLGKGETKIELIFDGRSKEINIGHDISWGFEVESLDQMLALVKEKGVQVDGDPIQPNPHVKFFFAKDPNGLRIQFVENIA